METDSNREYYFDINRCQRCGCNHKNMVFRLLTNPADEYQFWGMCDFMAEPLLLKVIGGPIQKDNQEKNENG